MRRVGLIKFQRHASLSRHVKGVSCAAVSYSGGQHTVPDASKQKRELRKLIHWKLIDVQRLIIFRAPAFGEVIDIVLSELSRSTMSQRRFAAEITYSIELLGLIPLGIACSDSKSLHKIIRDSQSLREDGKARQRAEAPACFLLIVVDLRFHHVPFLPDTSKLSSGCRMNRNGEGGLLERSDTLCVHREGSR